MENWRDNEALELPDELKTSEVLAQYETVGDALKGFVETKSMVGRSITIPTEEAGEEQWNEYYAKLRKNAPNLIIHPDHANDEQKAEFWRMAGVPDEAKDYAPAEGFEGLSDEYVENLRGIANTAGWTKKQFQTTLTELSKEFKSQQETYNESKAADVAIVDGKLGIAKAEKLSGIKALAEQFADPDHPPAWLQNPDMLTAGDILMMNNIVASFTGKGPQIFKQPVKSDALMPDEIRTQQTDIRTRMMNEQYSMPRQEYVRLQKKLVTLGQMLVDNP